MNYIVTAIIIGLSFVSSIVSAECTLTREECTYECIEYYPNGTDCRKTKKHCEQVCIEYRVDTSGQDTKNYPPPELKKSEPKKK